MEDHLTRSGRLGKSVGCRSGGKGHERRKPWAVSLNSLSLGHLPTSLKAEAHSPPMPQAGPINLYGSDLLGSLVAQRSKNWPAMWESWVSALHWRSEGNKQLIPVDLHREFMDRTWRATVQCGVAKLRHSWATALHCRPRCPANRRTQWGKERTNETGDGLAGFLFIFPTCFQDFPYFNSLLPKQVSLSC